jgi:hypothetical protein
MPWSKADREKYDVIRERYSSDLSDAEFAARKWGRRRWGRRVLEPTLWNLAPATGEIAVGYFVEIFLVS